MPDLARFAVVPALAVAVALALIPAMPATTTGAPPTPAPDVGNTGGAAPRALRLAETTAPRPRDLVRAVQERLTTLGYEPGPIDGIAGPKTRQAIGAFQAASGLAPDGSASRALLARLNAALEPVRETDETEAAMDDSGSAAEAAGFIAAWLLGTWRIDCAGDDPGLVFDRIAHDKTWSDEWTVAVDGARVRVCREAGGRFCYLYRRLGESRLVYGGYVGETGRTTHDIEVEKCD